MPVVLLPDWFIADVARDSHSIGSLISSFVHQTSGSWRGLVDDGQNVRVIRFQSLFKVIGITGYTFRIHLNSPLLFGRSLLHLGERSIRIQFIALAIDNRF